MNSQPLNLIILGPQGSGKGTQAQLLIDGFGYLMIGAGNSLREVAKTDTELGRRVKERIDQGKLVNSDDIGEVIKMKLLTVPHDQPVIFESYPRTLPQYEYMKSFWPQTSRGDFIAVFISLSEEESIRRLTSRRVCENCGTNYILGAAEKCLKCGGHLLQRHDDYPEAVKNRLAWSNSELMPLVNKLEEEAKLIRVNGEQTIEKVHNEISHKLSL